MPKAIVFHRGYGCDTGCCGHVVEIDGEQVGQFTFDHPYGQDFHEFIRELVEEQAGAEHVADIDWDNCLVSDD